MSYLYRGDANDMHAAKMPPGARFVKAGYTAAPLKGQWYLSGAKPTAYQAKGNMRSEYAILYPVRKAPARGFANPLYVPPPGDTI